MKHVNVIFSLRVDSRFHFNNMFVMPHVPCKFILAFWLTLDTSVMDHLSFQTLKCNYECVETQAAHVLPMAVLT